MPRHDLSRAHADPYAGDIPPLLLDRQRVVHSAAFRRLQHKTQVFVAPHSDHFRTRLTHTLEVAHQARLLATLLNLNADLAEVVALAHDLGHPPFGHAGERALADCLADHGGFEHNRHTLRIVEELEHPYPAFYGLNLTHAVRECLAKHSTQFDQPGPHPLQDGQPPAAESSVVDLADRLTYALHDVLDGLYAGVLDIQALLAVAIWRDAYDGPVDGSATTWRGHLRPTIDRMQQRILADVVAHARNAATPTATLSPALESQLAALDAFLLANLYRSTPLRAADEQARIVLRAVFTAFVQNPAELPDRFRKRLAQQDIHQVVTDYVAGMTDRFCADEHARLCG